MTNKNFTPAGVLQWARRLGWRIVPLDGKNPGVSGKGWGLRDHSPSEWTRNRNGIKPTNYGVVLGEASNNLVDIDLDSPEALAAAPYIFDDFNPVFFGRGGVRTHMIFTATDVPKEAKDLYLGMKIDRDGKSYKSVELRTGFGYDAKGKKIELQTMIPPSVHPSTSEKIEFFGDPPKQPEDLPIVPWSVFLERYELLCFSIGAEMSWKQTFLPSSVIEVPAALPKEEKQSKPAFRKKHEYENRVEWEDINAKLSISELLAELGSPPDTKGDINCPWHASSSGTSAKLHSSDKVFHCFGCAPTNSKMGTYYTIWDVVAEIEGLDPKSESDKKNIMKAAAARAGIDL